MPTTPEARGVVLRGMAPTTEARPYAGGLPFDPEPVAPVALHCVDRKPDGTFCGGFQSGDDGLCAGHRKRRLSQAS